MSAISPSKLSAWAVCPSYDSYDRCDLPDNSPAQLAARHGAALHKVMEEYVRQVGACSDSPTLLHELCGQFALDPADVETLQNAVNILTEVAPDLSSYPVYTEERIEYVLQVLDEPVVVRGVADLIIDAGARLIVIDYKFGKEEVASARVNAQGMAYVVGCFRRFERAEQIETVFIQPHVRSYADRHVFDRHSLPELERQLSNLIGRHVAAERSFATAPKTTGSHCARCVHSLRCPALSSVVQLSTRSLVPPGEFLPADAFDVLPDAEIVRYFYWSDTLLKVLETYRDKLRSIVLERDLVDREHVIPQASQTVAIRSITTSSIAPRNVRAQAALDAGFPADQLLDAATISLEQLRKHPAVLQVLLDRGLLSRTETTRIVVKAKPTQPELTEGDNT